MRKSVMARIVQLIIAIGFTIGVALLAFVWSLNNTISFTQSVMVEEPWGTIMGLVIQFGPQVFLALASTSSGTERTGWFSAFFIFSGVDAATNIGATLARLDAGVQMTALQLAVRIFLDIIIVFGEEMVGYGVSVIFHNLGELIELFGEEPPEWMFITEDVASRISTGYGARARGSKRRSKPRGKPQRETTNLSTSSMPPPLQMGFDTPPPDTVAAARRAAGKSGPGG